MTSIFVAKLDFNTTDEELKSLFERHGKVNRVTIAKDRETGKPRGFAFVEMFDESEAEAAIQALDNSNVNGRFIAVKKADDRSSSKPGGQAPSGDRPPRTENRPPRPEFRSNEERPAFKKQDEAPPVRPAFTPEESNPIKTDRKREKESFAKKEKPKQNKMEAYRKSGKSNRFFDDDEDDDYNWSSSRRTTGWDEEE